jgi:hypothetical protein
MKIGPSIQALHDVQANLNKVPGRIANAFHNPEAKEGLENIFTDMMTDENAFEANVKAIRSMTTVEDILLNELRNE